MEVTHQMDEYQRIFTDILDNIKNENKTLQNQKEHQSKYLSMLNQKVSMTYIENNEVLKQIAELDSQILAEELKNSSIDDGEENLILDDLEKEYAKELLALMEKINNYKEVFQIDIQSNKDKRTVIINFMNAEQKVILEYTNVKNIRASATELSFKVIEAEKDEVIKKLIRQFNLDKSEKQNISDLILKIHEQVKNI